MKTWTGPIYEHATVLPRAGSMHSRPSLSKTLEGSLRVCWPRTLSSYHGSRPCTQDEHRKYNMPNAIRTKYDERKRMKKVKKLLNALTRTLNLHLQVRTLGLRLNNLHAWVIQLSGLQKPLWTQIYLTRTEASLPTFYLKESSYLIVSQHGIFFRRDKLMLKKRFREDEVEINIGKVTLQCGHFPLNLSSRTENPLELIVFTPHPRAPIP